MFYIYMSQSYTCYDTKEPDSENLAAIRRGDMRLLKVDEGKLYGLRKDGTWKHIVPGKPLCQTIRHGIPVVDRETE